MADTQSLPPMPHAIDVPAQPLPESIPIEFGIGVELYGWIMRVLAVPGYELPDDTPPNIRRAFALVRHEIYRRLREVA